MAVPTITSITPDHGPAGGLSTVRIYGTNFRLYTPPAYGPVHGPAPSRVRVSFAGVWSPSVSVLSATELEVVTPEYPGDVEQAVFPAVDIVVENLTDAGVPIAGERVSAPGAYTFEREALRRPAQAPESPYVRITRAVLQLVKRQVLLNAGPHVHTDYSVDGISLAPADVPSIHVVGPDVTEDDYGWENEPIEEIQPDGSVLVYPNPMMHQFSYDLVGHSDSWPELLSLQAAFRKFPWNNAWLVIPGDVPAGSAIRMPILTKAAPALGTGIGNANLRTCSFSFAVTRVPILYLPPWQRTWAVESAELQTQKYNGTLVEVKNLW